MSDDADLEAVKTAMNKSRNEFDIAASLIATALKDVHERIERIELWITESQKSQQE